jgi:hypothetical protein
MPDGEDTSSSSSRDSIREEQREPSKTDADEVEKSHVSASALDDFNEMMSSAMILDEGQARISAEGYNTWWRHKVDWLLGATAGQLTAFFAVGLVLLVTGGLLWQSLGEHAEAEDEFKNSTRDFRSSMWVSWGMIFDPGTQTAVSPDAELQVKCVALVLSLFGFLYFLTILGIAVEFVRSMVDYSTEMCSRIVENNHTILLGWGNRTIYLLCELLAAYREERNTVAGWCGRRRYKRIVILADRPELEMRQEINMHFRKDDSGLSMARFLIDFREGDPTDWKDIERVSASSADDILILRDEGARQTSDAQAIQCCLAISALSRDPKKKVTGEVFAEIHNPKILGMVEACQAIGVVLRRTSVRMLCQQTLFPDVGEAIQKMVSFTTNHVYLVDEIPPALHGRTFLEASMCYPGATLIGTRKGSNDRDSLVFVAESEPVYVPMSKDVFRNRSQDPSVVGKPSADSVDSSPPAVAAVSDSSLVASSGDDDDDQADMSRVRSERLHMTTIQRKGRNIIVMIGSPSDIALHTFNMKDLAKTDSLELHVLTSLNKKTLNKIPIDNSTGKVIWHPGDPSDPHALKLLPLEEAASIVVLAFKAEQDEPAAATDARSLSTVFQLQERLKGRDTPIICELWDIRSKAIAQSDTFKGIASFFHSVRVETALFATAADDTQVFNVLMTLVEPNGTDLFVAKARDLGLHDGSTASSMHAQTSNPEAAMDNFWTLREKIQEVDPNNVLIGWKREILDEGGDVMSCEWEVNPKDKAATFTLHNERNILFLILRVRRDEAGSRSSTGAMLESFDVPTHL